MFEYNVYMQEHVPSQHVGLASALAQDLGIVQFMFEDREYLRIWIGDEMRRPADRCARRTTMRCTNEQNHFRAQLLV